MTPLHPPPTCSLQTRFPGKSPKYHFVATHKLDFSGSQPRRGIVRLPVCRVSIWSLWEEVSMCTYRACTFTGRDSKWASTHGNYSLFCLAIANRWEHRHKSLKRFREIGAVADWRDGWFDPRRYGGGLSWYLSLSFYSISSLVILSEPQALLTSQITRQVQCGISLLMTGMELRFQRFFDVLLPWYLLCLVNRCRVQSAFSPGTAGPGFWKWSQSIAEDSAGSKWTIKSCWNFIRKLSSKIA